MHTITLIAKFRNRKSIDIIISWVSQISGMHASIVIGGGKAIAVLLAAGESALMEPRIGTDRHRRNPPNP